MSNHGRDELTGEVRDADKLNAVVTVLDEIDPCGLRGKRHRDYASAAREIAETCEGISIRPTDGSVALVAQVALYRHWGREWLDEWDRPLARRIADIYWPTEKPTKIESGAAPREEKRDDD